MINTKKMKKILYISIIFITISVWSQKPEELFSQGNEAYKKGDYQTAISLYEKVLQSGKQSEELFFNLANAYYKLNQIAPSIYYYEKALQLNPGDDDALYNLSLANQMKLDKINQVPENVLLRFKKTINRIFSFDTWAWLAVVSAFAGLIIFLIFLFTTNANTKRWAFSGMFISLFLVLFTWYNAHYGKQLSTQKYGIVFANQVDILTEPNLTADKVTTLHEGTKVQLLRTDGDWQLIKLPDGKKAWIPKTDVKAL
jgi:tetratricopeptide (TPR) repeat protein